MARDYYEILGVSRTATNDDLQRAFRTQARRYHPDVNRDPDAADRFKEVNEAYHVLADPETRARYDRFGPDFRRIPADAAAAGGGPRVRRGAPATSGSRARVGGGRSGGINIEDLFGDADFEDLFGSWRSGGPMPGADQEAELPLSVAEAYRGGSRRITLSGPDGPRTFDITVPPGVTDGRRIRLSGQGGEGSSGGPSGDLYLRVRILPDPRFRLQGRDIHVDALVAPWEAALGATVPVVTPDGDVKVKIPPGSSSGRRIRLAGEGMPNPRGKPGDLYAEIKIMVPPKLSRPERELFEELSRKSHFDARRAQK